MAAYIFDFDGTIADSFDYVLDFLSREITGKPARHHSQYRGLSMRTMAVKLGASPWRLPFLFFKGRKKMGPAIASVKAIEGMPELLRDLHAQGHQLFLVSVNLRQTIMPFLYANHLDGYFTEVYGSASIFGKAPLLRMVCKKQQLQNAWYVGDEGNDVRAAHMAGLRAAAVTWGYNNLQRLKAQEPDALCFTTDELRKALTA